MNITKFLNQDAVYWPPSGKDTYGNVSYGEPVDKKVRIVIQKQSRSSSVGDLVNPEASILSVDLLAPLGMIALGKVADLPSDDSPEANGGYVIRTVLPYVDRRGNTLAYEISTATPFSMSGRI